MVVLTAAADGTSALETGAKGIFTTALVEVLGPVEKGPITYAQAARQVAGLVAARSPQIPFFQGRLDREVFGTAGRPRPVSWEVKGLGPPLELTGLPLPGMGKNAELRIYSPSVSRADMGDPSKAKATVLVEESTGVNAKARLSGTPGTGRQPVAVGDLALLVRPSDEAVQVSVRIRPAKEPGGIAPDRAVAIRKAIDADLDARISVQVTTAGAEFDLATDEGGRLQIRGVADEVRRTAATDAEAAKVLWQLARQKALASLRGEGKPLFVDEETLRVEIVPAPTAVQGPCGTAKVNEFAPRPVGSVAARQIVPLCLAYQIKVTAAKDSPRPLLLGGVVLSGDGGTYGFPRDGSAITLKAGESHTFPELYRATPPLGAVDTIKVFGTLQTNPVAWHLLTSDEKTRSAGKSPSPLHRSLERYLVAGTRGSTPEGQVTGDDSQWTVSTVAVQVEANPRFLEAPAGGPELPQAKEYTIRGFDVRPYLPDDPASALHKVLAQADALARRQVSYKQHAWEKASDEANLAAGIDCSRATWFAFSRAGLSYGPGNGYLTTAQLAPKGSPLARDFDRCDGQPLQIGDLVVYRDDQQGDGHVVMVIDPLRRIAWGSHGWDGTAKELKVEPATGVEYQLIKYKPDWGRWDRTNMVEKACWRHRALAAEAAGPKGRPGVKAIESPCQPASCSGGGG
jgi:hypothetical protein